ncbi:MAG: hypothetical protein GYB68_10765 [Chloroflexi bacterium]|nr:hypothetical protein [Chloroflexota bacterium]
MAERPNQEPMNGPSSTGRTTQSGAIAGGALLAIGLFLLVAQIFNISIWSFIWPFFVIGPGLLFFAFMALLGKNWGWLALPGSVITTTGLILMYAATFGHFAFFAYGWALIFPTSIGVGLLIYGQYSELERVSKAGMAWTGIGLALFAAGGVFFELLLNISDNLLANLFWPAVLISGR